MKIKFKLIYILKCNEVKALNLLFPSLTKEHPQWKIQGTYTFNEKLEMIWDKTWRNCGSKSNNLAQN